MIDNLGEDKALGKIEVLDKNPRRHRPDPDSLKDYEFIPISFCQSAARVYQYMAFK